MPLPLLDGLAAAGVNAWDFFLGEGVADTRPTPSRVVYETPAATLHAHRLPRSAGEAGAPVLLMPPLAGPPTCFDLRRGQSLVEHLLRQGHHTYLLRYAAVGLADRRLGMEHWVDQVVPDAIRGAANDDGGRPVHVLSWSLGGIFALLAAAAQEDLPIASIIVVGTPVDTEHIWLAAPLRPLAAFTGGAVGTLAYRTLGVAPRTLVRRSFQLASLDKYLTRPFSILTHLHDREHLAAIQGVDRFTEALDTYPGRTMGQLYHRLFRLNDLADGRMELGERELDLADVRAPVLAVAGESDPLAPTAAVHRLGELLIGSTEVRLETAPGGHLGVLAGRSARDTTWEYVLDWLSALERGEPRRERE